MIQGSDRKRLFIDVTREGCPCACKYCFVRRADETLLSEEELERLPQSLQSHPCFVAGRSGTILAFGSHCDLFRESGLAQQLFRAVGLVAPLGNPIQVATKHRISRESAACLAGALTVPNQLTVCVSCSTIRRARQYEPRAMPPNERFESFAALRACNIPGCLYVKPFLPGITDRELGDIADAVLKWRPDACCVGSLGMDLTTHARIQVPAGTLIDPSGTHPLMKDMIGVVQPTRKFLDELRDRCGRVPVFEHSLCVVAYSLRGQCLLHGVRCSV